MHTRLNLVFICVVIICVFFLYNLEDNNYRIKVISGKWTGKLNNQLIEFYFNTDESCKLNIIDNYNEIQTFYGNCKFNFKKKPYTLDIIQIDNIGSIYASFKFTNKNTLMITKFSNQKKLRKILITEENSIKLSNE